MKADYSNPSAYRPISISSHIGKVFERILNRRVMRYKLSEKLIDIEQEGFLPKKNTVRSLFRLKLECDFLKKSKLCAALINLDLEKAFDSVWQKGLLLKLWTAGIRGSLFNLLRNFLKCRLIRTILEGVLSSLIKPKQGVPQGSVLSPLLFIFFIAEKLQNTDGTKFKYADDSQFLVSAETQASLCEKIQENLKSVKTWCNTWRIQINELKTEILHIHPLDIWDHKFHLGTEKVKYITKIPKIFQL